jgi:hypothetical protein
MTSQGTANSQIPAQGAGQGLQIYTPPLNAGAAFY